MSLHYPISREIDNHQYQARCQCGWRGPKRDSKLTAENDAARHAVLERPPGSYA